MGAPDQQMLVATLWKNSSFGIKKLSIGLLPAPTLALARRIACLFLWKVASASDICVMVRLSMDRD